MRKALNRKQHEQGPLCVLQMLAAPVKVPCSPESRSAFSKYESIAHLPEIFHLRMRWLVNNSSAGTASATTPGSALDGIISPLLLRRAEAIAKEHDKLSVQNAEEYDTTAAKRIGEIAQVAEVFKKLRETEEANAELESVLAPDYPFKELQPDARIELDHNVTTLLPQLARDLEKSLIPPHPFAKLPALMEIHPGAGGSEASLFAANLLRMYLAFCSRLGLPTEILKRDQDDSVSGEGIAEAILEIPSPGAYDLLRTEAGVHRVQRVPATEKKGRTHTSAVSVVVLPSFTTTASNPNSSSPSDDPQSDPTSTDSPSSASSSSDTSTTDPTSPNYIIPPNEVRVETMRARGAGGQHVNKTSSAIRLTHFSSGIVISMQESRSQHSNRAKAWQLLRAKLAQRHREEKEREASDLRRRVMGGVGLKRVDRGDKVRTYNWEQRRVTDHRSGGETRDLDGVLEGGEPLVELMSGVRNWLGEREVEALVLEEEVKDRERKGK